MNRKRQFSHEKIKTQHIISNANFATYPIFIVLKHIFSYEYIVV